METNRNICYKELVTINAGGKPTLVSHFNTKHLAFWTTPKTLEPKQSLKRTTGLKWATLTKSRIVPCHVIPLSALSTMSLPSVQTVIKFTNWIPKIMKQFCYLRLYFGIDNIAYRLLQWIASTKNGLNRRPKTRYRTYSNQISTRLIPIRWWKCRGRWLLK